MIRSVIVATMLASSAHAQDWKRLVGEWKLDTAASSRSGGGRGDVVGRASGGGGGMGGGIGLGPPASALVITADDTLLTIEERDGDASSTIHYRFDGKRVKNTIRVGRGRPAEATYESRWRRGAVESAIRRIVTNPAGTVTMRYRERIFIRPDSALVQEVTLQGRGSRLAVFRR